MDFVDTLINIAQLDHPALDAAAARLPRRPLFRARRHLRHRPRGQDAGRRLCRRGGGRRLPARPGSGSARHPDRRRASRWCTASPRSPIAATRSSRASRSTSSPPAPPSFSARPGSARAAARRRCRPEARFGAITLPGADALRDVPVIGPLYSGLLSGHNVLAYVAFLAGAVHLVGAVPHPLRPAPARRRREPGRRRYGRHLGRLAALPRRHLHRHPHRHCRLPTWRWRRMPASSRT